LLDLLHGTYPFVTGSHTIAGYISPALGIPPSLSGDPLGVAKCYTTRIGSGPFPTEVKGGLGDSIRRLGNEYGSTTGRPRRVGWLDLVSLKYSVRLNGVKKIAITKLDVLAGIKEFKICTAYSDNGTETVDFQKALSLLDTVKPVYESPLSMFRVSFDTGLPRQAKKFVDYLEHELGVKVILLSHGNERSKTIEL
jgi:adenylosuccinate synthase